ncbi:Rv3654c family TadE-like protein, partial [Nocardia sp. NPDC058640]|uniref:Rv3654c family TadE-like protein n=1 Tax=Nocardia sp. NPDC058640 TaxID=3346571 RepID=UPI0036552CEB
LHAERRAALHAERRAALHAERRAALHAERRAALHTERRAALHTERRAALHAERRAALHIECGAPTRQRAALAPWERAHWYWRIPAPAPPTFAGAPERGMGQAGKTAPSLKPSGSAPARPFGSVGRWLAWRGLAWRGLAGDAGAASVFVCVVLAGLIGMTLVVAQVGAVVVARHRAQGAADLAALGAAVVLVEGAEAGCGEAGEIAARMGARVRRCAVAQWDVVVEVEANVPAGVFGVRTVRASARAGPVEENG